MHFDSTADSVIGDVEIVRGRCNSVGYRSCVIDEVYVHRNVWKSPFKRLV